MGIPSKTRARVSTLMTQGATLPKGCGDDLHLCPREGRGRALGRGLLFAEKMLVAPPARKNGKLNEMPCHHKLEEYLDAYMKAAGIADDRKGPLFRAAIGKTKELGAGLFRARMSGIWCAAALLTRASRLR
jgi:hypothetical protein